jgi:6-phosphogluconolactonase (cycloisomerase 2 family)
VAAQYGVWFFERNTTTGELDYIDKLEYDDPGAEGLYGACSITVSPNNDHVYVASRDHNAVAALDRNPSTGILTFNHAIQSFRGMNGPVGIAISSEGESLYVAGNDADAVVTLSRNAATGVLKYYSTKYNDPLSTDGLDGARSIAISPDDAHLYVAGYNDNAVAVFDIYAPTGGLVFVEVVKDGDGGVVDGLDGAQFVTISPDGKNVYVACYDDNAVAVFSRNTTSGEIDFVESEHEGTSCTDWLGGAYSIAISPDGNHAYVASISDNAITAFSRSPSTGELECIDKWYDGDGVVEELEGANSIVISPDGYHVYVAARVDDAVVHCFRNPGNGMLLCLDEYTDTDPGVDGLNGARSLALSVDGGYLYVASQYEDAIAVFRRNISTGGLTYLGMVKDNQDGVDGLNTADGIAVSPDGLFVYAVSYGDDAVVGFARNALYLPAVKK